MTTLLLHAYMPEATGRSCSKPWTSAGRELAEFGSRSRRAALGELAPLFPKLEPAEWTAR